MRRILLSVKVHWSTCWFNLTFIIFAFAKYIPSEIALFAEEKDKSQINSVYDNRHGLISTRHRFLGKFCWNGWVKILIHYLGWFPCLLLCQSYMPLIFFCRRYVAEIFRNVRLMAPVKLGTSQTRHLLIKFGTCKIRHSWNSAPILLNHCLNIIIL